MATSGDTPDVVVYQSSQQTQLGKLFAEMLSNISKTRSEISMTFAGNARA